MIALAWPSKKIKKVFHKNEEIIFIDDQGLWVFSKDSSKRILVSNTNYDIPDELFDIPNAKRYLNWWMPIWTRWVPHADQYEKVREQLLVSTYNIFNMLNHYNINCIIFFTGVAHHLDSSILSIACRLKKIKQIYLYAQVINGRLLPILQSDDISTRTPLNIDVSDFQFKKNIDEFLNRKIAGDIPKLNFSEKSWKKNLTLSILFILRREIYKIINKVIFPRKYLENFLIPKQISKHSFLEDLRVINSQRLYLRAFSNSIISDKKMNELRLNEKPKLLIAAHYQPEATSFPEGNDYTSHIDIVIAIRNKKYKAEIIYKEHSSVDRYIEKIIGLTKVGISRSETYLELLKKLGCIFLQKDYHLSLKDDYKWYVPVTITGTIAIERALVGLHTIYTGTPWYKGLPGTLHIDDIDSLELIPEEWTKPNELIARNARAFLYELLNNKTIANFPGIGTGVPDDSEISAKDFELGILKIMKIFHY